MQKYDFDTVRDRRGSGALKTDALRERYGRDDLVALWVADMDFDTPPFVVEALRRRLDHPIFGYAVVPDDYWSAIRSWLLSHHGWDVRREWLRYIPGIVKGIGMAVNVFVGKDEKVIIQPPVYHPFRLTPEGNRREVVYNPLVERPGGTYVMDFEGLERVADERCRMLILSNPHNPAGVVWDAATLRRLAHICHERGIIVVSDEIHCDMALFGNKHVPFATVSDEAAECSITFSAPSKTFNIAGIVSSFAVVRSERLRRPFFEWLAANEFDDPPIFSVVAATAAYRQGEEWRRQMLAYVEQNILFVEEFLRREIPAVIPWRPQASFLVWLDCRRLGLDRAALVDLFVTKARLALNDGAMFGAGGEGFMRLNVGTSRSILAQALASLRDAVASL